MILIWLYGFDYMDFFFFYTTHLFVFDSIQTIQFMFIWFFKYEWFIFMWIFSIFHVSYMTFILRMIFTGLIYFQFQVILKQLDFFFTFFLSNNSFRFVSFFLKRLKIKKIFFPMIHLLSSENFMSDSFDTFYGMFYYIHMWISTNHFFLMLIILFHMGSQLVLWLDKLMMSRV